MHWQESADQPDSTSPSRVVDMVFRMRCDCLPLDHALSLLQAIENALPWFSGDLECGVHSIHGAESAHGWHRPVEGEAQLIRLSKRVRLALRVPLDRVDACARLSDRTLVVSDQVIELGSYKLRTIVESPSLFARRVLSNNQESEEIFVDRVQQQLSGLDVNVPKLLPGQQSAIKTSAETLLTRSLLLADVPLQDSIRIQEAGLGSGRKLGCGIFVPYKSIASIES